MTDSIPGRGELDPVEIDKNMISINDDLYMMVLGDGRGKWDVNTKILAASYYMVLGSMRKTHEHLKAIRRPVPVTTLCKWTHTDWWWRLKDEVRRQKADEFEALTTKAIHSAVGAVQDRLDDGDYHVDKDGELIRIPVKAKDAAVVAGVLYDKRALARGDPTKRISRETPEETLQKIANFFQNMPQTQTIEAKKVEAVETEYSEVKE